MSGSDETTFILIALLAIIICFVFINKMSYVESLQNVSNEKSKKCKRRKHHKKNTYPNYGNYDPNLTYDANMDDILNDIKSREMSKNKGNVNIEFINVQYHQDYNDTITAINNLTPQKELFNLSFLPVKETVPEPGTVTELVNLFMTKMNNEVKSNVSEFLHVNSGWGDMGKRKRIKSGFEEQMEELGLPGNLYNEPASKSAISLISIDKAEQYTTDTQIRFTVYLIVQKHNVKDQMVLKVQFFMERNDEKEDRENFFNKKIYDNMSDLNKKNSGDNIGNQTVIIEQVFTPGYLTGAATSKTNADRFYDYGKITSTDGTIDQAKVLQIMMEKHKERARDLNTFMSNIDDETREIHDAPALETYESYKNTRTIIDDLKKFPQHSFGDVPI